MDTWEWKFSKILARGTTFFSGNDVENDFEEIIFTLDAAFTYEKIISRTTCKKFTLKFILTFIYFFYK